MHDGGGGGFGGHDGGFGGHGGIGGGHHGGAFGGNHHHHHSTSDNGGQLPQYGFVPPRRPDRPGTRPAFLAIRYGSAAVFLALLIIAVLLTH